MYYDIPCDSDGNPSTTANDLGQGWVSESDLIQELANSGFTDRGDGIYAGPDGQCAKIIEQ